MSSAGSIAAIDERERRLMSRPVCWTERLEDGTRREVRVAVGRRDVKWQYKLSTAEKWDYDSPPSPADWDALLERMESRYQRRTVSFESLEFVRRLHGAARGG